MIIPVLKETPEGTELVPLDLNDVVYICVENRTLVYHTQNERYQHITTLSELGSHLKQFGFDLTDKTNLVNFNKIQKVDTKQGKLYFEESPGTESKYATIAFVKQKTFEQQIQRAIANNTRSSLEFTIKENNTRSTYHHDKPLQQQ